MTERTDAAHAYAHSNKHEKYYTESERLAMETHFLAGWDARGRASIDNWRDKAWDAYDQQQQEGRDTV